LFDADGLVSFDTPTDVVLVPPEWFIQFNQSAASYSAMDQNSLPMMLELETFPRVVRLVVFYGTLAVVGLFVLVVLIGVLSI
jgi:hypothetical protein